MKTEPTTTIITITPQMARDWLAHQIGNRKLRKRHVEELAREMTSGNWKVTHQGFAFADDGTVIDGQHRLAAIVLAGVPVRAMVTTGMDREAALRAVDQGLIRTRGDLFGMRGETDRTKKAAVCRTLGLLITPDLPYGQGLGPSGDFEVLNTYRSAIEMAVKDGERFSSGYLAVAALAIHHLPAIGAKFSAGVGSGANLDTDDPRYVLRDFLLHRSRTSGTAHRASLIVKSACAAQAFFTGERLARAHMSHIRFRGFCESLGIPVNRSLHAFAGGKILRSGVESE